MKMGTRCGMGKRLLLVMALSSFFLATGFARAADHAGGGAGYLKSATYYSDDWVVNFWNSESIHMEEELAQIAADGFNNIILAVPWREFQPGISPCTYNEYAWQKLDRVMEAAERAGLSVMLRVGYTWDYCGKESVLNRYQGLIYHSETRAAWLQYVDRLYRRASAHGNFCGGFLTWEDFWNFTENAARLGRGNASRAIAQACGYTGYASLHYSLEELEEMYGHSLASWEELYMPSRDSYARKVFFEYYDQFLNELLAESQTVFPDLSMEVRLDIDPVNQGNGIMEGAPHYTTFSCGNSSYTSAMFSVSMGFLSQYERVEAAEAAANAPYFLEELKAYNGGKPIYIDQFLFTDNTEGFENNAQLRTEEKPLYLDMAPGFLKPLTMGYGIWTYRDYGDNKVFNSQFALGKEGWEFSGDCRVTEINGNKTACLSSGSRIRQDTGSRMTGTAGQDTNVRFRLRGEGSCTVTVQVGSQTKTVAAGKQSVQEVVFKNCAPVDISFSYRGKGAAYVDDVNVYTCISEGELYHMDGSEGSCIDALRRMNGSL